MSGIGAVDLGVWEIRAAKKLTRQGRAGLATLNHGMLIEGREGGLTVRHYAESRVSDGQYSSFVPPAGDIQTTRHPQSEG